LAEEDPGEWWQGAHKSVSKVARSKGHARALMAVARKLEVILFAMWRDGTEYRWGADPMAKTARRPRKIKLLEAAQ
jgi:hypothetical protein